MQRGGGGGEMGVLNGKYLNYYNNLLHPFTFFRSLRGKIVKKYHSNQKVTSFVSQDTFLCLFAIANHSSTFENDHQLTKIINCYRSYDSAK